jgi:hypothetical protein
MTVTAATPSLVLWTIAAQRHLRQALAKAACDGKPSAVSKKMNDLSQRLRKLFDNPRGIVVQQQFVGYRRRDDEFILLVEVDDPNRPGRHVVKLGPEESLWEELEAWQSCQPYGLRHDIVFMTLEARPGGNGALAGLVYGDAQQFIGVSHTTPLEHAFLGAVRHDSPSAASIALVFGQLYERIGHLLYSQSFEVDPAPPKGPPKGGSRPFVLRLPKVRRTLAAWEEPDSDAARIRQAVHTWAASGRGEFRDPVDYLRFLETFVPWSDDPAKKPVPPPSRGVLIHQWVPRMLRGCAHGDLHGRNVLVGVVRDRALWPAIFDYEHMGPGNLLGWDFVKMEMELKMRAFRELFPGGTDAQFVAQVQQFEIALAGATERAHTSADWPKSVPNSDQPARLQGLLLALRQQAALHLGADRGRPRDWLDEFYFLLACYGVSVVRFPSLHPRERMGAFLSAGVATARFLYNRERL